MKVKPPKWYFVSTFFLKFWIHIKILESDAAGLISWLVGLQRRTICHLWLGLLRWVRTFMKWQKVSNRCSKPFHHSDLLFCFVRDACENLLRPETGLSGCWTKLQNESSFKFLVCVWFSWPGSLARTVQCIHANNEQNFVKQRIFYL